MSGEEMLDRCSLAVFGRHADELTFPELIELGERIMEAVDKLKLAQ